MEEKSPIQFENDLALKEKQEDEKRNIAFKEGFIFDEKDKNKLVKYKGKNSVVIIPDFVTSIDKRAFYLCDFITTIFIPKSVKKIEEYAIDRCDHLTIYSEKRSKPRLSPKGWYSLWNGLRPVHLSAKKENIIFQNGVQYLIKNGKAILTGHTHELPKKVVIPSSITVNEKKYKVTSIGALAFAYCEELTSIEIPNSITSINSWAFALCRSLTSILIPSSVVSIGQHTFSNCDSLTIYCEGERKLVGWDFGWNEYIKTYWNVKKEDIIFQNGLQYLLRNGSAIVTGYTKRISKNVGIPETIIVNKITYQVTNIGNEAFSNCKRLTSITIPNCVIDIGKRTFYNCSKLISVVLPKDITYIGTYTFANCSSLKSITIPGNVKCIGEHAFDECSSLSSLVIPRSVTTIENSVFYQCGSLTVYCEANSKPISEWELFWFGDYKKASLFGDCKGVYYLGEWSYVDGIPTPNNQNLN